MEKETRILALISRTTRELFERHVRATGVKQGRLVEQALRDPLQGLPGLPADFIVHRKPVVTRKSGTAMLKRMETGKPTDARDPEAIEEYFVKGTETATGAPTAEQEAPDSATPEQAPENARERLF